MLSKTLISKWAESIQTFKPANLKIFILASLNTVIRSLGIIVKNLWWMILFVLVPLALSSTKLFFLQFIPGVGLWVTFYKYVLLFVGFLPAAFLTFFIFLTVRPSVENKNIYYFMRYSKYFIFFLLIFFLQALASRYFFHILYIFPFFWIISFFFLDSKGKFVSIFSSIFNGFKAAVFYLPMLFILGLFNWGRAILSNKLLFLTQYDLLISKILGFGAFVIIGLLMELLLISFLSVYYTKIKHSDFKFFIHK